MAGQQALRRRGLVGCVVVQHHVDAGAHRLGRLHRLLNDLLVQDQFRHGLLQPPVLLLYRLELLDLVMLHAPKRLPPARERRPADLHFWQTSAALDPEASSPSASRNFLMISSVPCRFRFIESLPGYVVPDKLSSGVDQDFKGRSPWPAPPTPPAAC